MRKQTAIQISFILDPDVPSHQAIYDKLQMRRNMSETIRQALTAHFERPALAIKDLAAVAKKQQSEIEQLQSDRDRMAAELDALHRQIYELEDQIDQWQKYLQQVVTDDKLRNQLRREMGDQPLQYQQ